MSTIDILMLTLQRIGGGSVTVYYPVEELTPGYRLLEGRRFADDHPWPEIVVKAIDCVSVTFCVADVPEEEYPPFEVTLDRPLLLPVEEVGEMTFILEPPVEDDDAPADDDGRYDAWA